jgi:chromate transporter
MPEPDTKPRPVLPAAPDATSLVVPASPREMFVAFTALALQGFGGVLPVAQRVLVEQRRWLSRDEFVKLLGLAQVLPGPNVVNLSLMVGDRFFGWRGALASVAGMLAAPLVVVLALALFTQQARDVPGVAGALRGMGVVAAGLVFATVLKLAGALRKNALGLWGCAALAGTTLALVGGLRWPLVAVVLGLGIVAVAWAWVRFRGQA